MFLGESDEPMARRAALSFVEDYDRAEAEGRRDLVTGRPGPTGDSRYDALLAALVEHLCSRDGQPSPAWTRDDNRFLDRWWFMSGLLSLHAIALAESPISFARRGVFICDGALTYA